MPKSKMKTGVGGVGLTLQIHACSLGNVKGERSDNFNIGLFSFLFPVIRLGKQDLDIVIKSKNIISFSKTRNAIDTCTQCADKKSNKSVINKDGTFVGW